MGISIWHWIIVLLTIGNFVAFVWGAASILKRTGRSSAWAILAIFPGISGFVLFWIGHTRWPNLPAPAISN